jgi:hypothetical protein
MRSRTPATDSVERTQTGVRLEKRLLKVCKAMAELYDLSLAEFLEDLVRDAFAGRQGLSGAALAQVTELARIYGMEPSPAPHDYQEAGA